MLKVITTILLFINVKLVMLDVQIVLLPLIIVLNVKVLILSLMEILVVIHLRNTMRLGRIHANVSDLYQLVSFNY